MPLVTLCTKLGEVEVDDVQRLVSGQSSLSSTSLISVTAVTRRCGIGLRHYELARSDMKTSRATFSHGPPTRIHSDSSSL
jgi:hypothetical protein